MSMRNMLYHSLPSFCSTMKRSHIRVPPSFINENDVGNVESFLEFLPVFAVFGIAGNIEKL
jgi:hypothetical protein